MPEWWRTFFDLEYARGDLIPATAEARAGVAERVAGLRTLLRLEPGSTLFDQCCGVGRMSHAFGRLGIRTVGVDLVPEYVECAAQVAAAENLPCRFEQGDAFEFAAQPACDAGINWFTSFGYSGDDRRSATMLTRMRDSLRPGARFAIDYLNVPRLMAAFHAARFRRLDVPDGAGTVVLEESAFDWRGGLLRSTWTFLRQDGSRDERSAAIRLFMPHELIRLIEGSGFDVIDLLGHPDGRTFERESPRLVIVSERRR